MRIPFIQLVWKLHLIAIVVMAILVPTLIYAGVIRVPTIEFLNGMAWQDKAKPQSTSGLLGDGVVARVPVHRTVARGAHVYPYERDLESASRLLSNPLRPTEANLRRGEMIFDTYCQPCHGFKGMADGSAVGPGRLAAPTLLHTDKARDELTDGALFHIVTVGQNKMPSYAKQVPPMDRWAAVNHIRVLQRAMAPRPEDLPKETDAQ